MVQLVKSRAPAPAPKAKPAPVVHVPAPVEAPSADLAAELGETEKPAIPIVLVLTSVNVGLEAQFMQFFSSLSAEESAATVEKLAVQAEERILANAEANKTAGASRGF